MMRYFDSYLMSDDEFWVDIKCEDVRFPRHDENMNGVVHTYSIEELETTK